MHSAMTDPPPFIAFDSNHQTPGGGWLIHPVISQLLESHLLGGVLWPEKYHQPPFAIDDLDPLDAIDQATASTLAAMAILPHLPGSTWLAVPVHPRALTSARSWWRQLSTQIADLSACREECGRRLVFIVIQADGIEQADSTLLRNLAEIHTLALALDEPSPAALRIPLSWPISRLILGAPSCSGIDTDSTLQQQWRFLSRAASELNLPVAVMGVETASELAWLRRQGAKEASGPALAPPLSFAAFAALRA